MTLLVVWWLVFFFQKENIAMIILYQQCKWKSSNKIIRNKYSCLETPWKSRWVQVHKLCLFSLNWLSFYFRWLDCSISLPWLWTALVFLCWNHCGVTINKLVIAGINQNTLLSPHPSFLLGLFSIFCLCSIHIKYNMSALHTNTMAVFCCQHVCLGTVCLAHR